MLFTVVARNVNEIYEIKTFADINVAFDFAYKNQKSFAEKGGWLLEVECACTGQLVEDDRLEQLA